MKKTFQLHQPGKDDQRVVEAIKNDVRKYVKRERRKTLPTGVDFWDFDCRVGPDTTAAEARHLAEVAPAIERALKLKSCVFLDFHVEAEENVYPMVPAGQAINKMLDGGLA